MENIRTLSVEELGIDNEIETSILILNNIIQESIYQKNVFTTLEQELDISKNYLTLMQLRYSDIQINWDIDNSLLSYAVFKFSIQPIMENCFSHAFTLACSSPNKITISAFRANKNCMCIRIEDNGRGMDRETYARINDQLSSIYNDGENAHIGIYNVHKRITTVFGSEFGIKIFPKAQGLVVEIDYPCLSLPPAPTDRL